MTILLVLGREMRIGYFRSKKLLWVAFLCLQLAGCGALAKTSNQISQQALIAQTEAGTAPFILDVRTVQEYEAGHIPGAVNIHFREVGERLAELPEGPVVLYCERGIRASIAARTLQEAGIDSVLLEGDISKWRHNNLPLTIDNESSEARQHSAETVSLLQQSLEQRWIVSGSEAKQLIDQGATVLDTRKLALTRLQGAIYVNWKQFSPKDAVTQGRLLDDDQELTQKLQYLGISSQKPVVVFANPPGGWGEDGRIVWMLRTLGHTQAVMVDGGFDALVEAGIPAVFGKQPAAVTGDFVVNRQSDWEIQRDELKASLGDVLALDTREFREFEGHTPYGEKRGGHVPGAIHLYFKELLDEDGYLLPTQEIRARLEHLGIMPETQIVVYCTGGIRSGWLASVLVTLNYPVRNYAGSMWEWSAAPAENYPLEIL